MSDIQPRMPNPATILPQSYKGIGNLLAAVASGGLSPATIELTALRVSQLNGCATCINGHATTGAKAGLTTAQMLGVSAFRTSPFFDAAQKAALELAEALTLLAGSPEEPLDDALWERVCHHYDETQRAALILNIATSNLFNRINVAVREDVENPFWLR